MELVCSTDSLLDLKERTLLPPHWSQAVRRIGIAEYREAGLSLSLSFAADDFCRYLLDADDTGYSAEERWKLHVFTMTSVVAAHCYKGIVSTIGPDYDAVALWLPPGEDLEGRWTSFRSGLWRLRYKLSAEARKRYYDEILPILGQVKTEVMGDRDCYYLVYLGTKPTARGRGYAGKLLTDMIEKADEENRPVYLESSSLVNNAYYAKFGFATRKDVYFKRGRSPVRLSIMVREPQTPKCG